MSNTLSICILTHNDQEYIGQCILQSKQLADEIIVVDLGSNDNTIQIVTEMKIRCDCYQWNNNFSEVKNYCMNQAVGRWVLFLQAYERISQDEIAIIRQALENPNTEGYLLYCDYQLESYGVYSPIQNMRLVRNRSEYRFRYESFEQLPDDVIGSIEDLPVTLRNQQIEKVPWDIQWRIDILAQEMNNNQGDCYLNYVYGIVLLNEQNMEESMKYLEVAYAKVNLEYLYTPHLYKCLILEQIMFQKYDRAMKLLEEAILFFPYYRDYYILRAELFRLKKEYEKAIQDLHTCIENVERANYNVPSPELGTEVAIEALGDVYKELFYYEKALDCYCRAVEFGEASDELLMKQYILARVTKNQEILKKIGTFEYELDESFEEFYIESARYWIENNRLDVVVEMEKQIIEEEEKREFEEQVCGLLIYYKHYDSAKAYIRYIHSENKELLTELLSLYKKQEQYLTLKTQFDLTPIMEKENNIKRAEQEQCIGDYFISKNKIATGIIAYKRALNINPLCKELDRKMIYAIHRLSSEQMDCDIDIQKWLPIFQGIEAFYEGNLELAKRMLSQDGMKDVIDPIIIAYRISIQWIEEDIDVITRYKTEKQMLKKVVEICRDYIISKLNKLNDLGEYGGLVSKLYTLLDQ